ncbi:LysR family transcriptional regulator, partial [Streptomyces sp. NPDC007971]
EKYLGARLLDRVPQGTRLTPAGQRFLPRAQALYEAQESADPVHLARLFGIHPKIAVKYVHTVHPDKALPRIR